MRVAIVATTPPDTYSGGRYYSCMVAEALAAGGHEVYYCTNHVPIFFADLAAFPDHDKVRLTLTDDFASNLPEGDFDAVFLTPGTGLPGFYHRVEIFAIERSAHLVFINFESGNWFNALSPAPRSLDDWAPWKRAASHASAILSISQEGDRWAKDFYTDVWEPTRFDYCYPPVNTPAADSVGDVPKEKRILLFMRFSTSLHKGSGHLDQLFCEAMRGYTLVVVLGKEAVPTPILERLVALATQYNVRLEFKQKLSDVEKFREIKRASLVLFPSQFEGFGYPPVEAQYCGTHCVAFDLPVLRETCGDRLFLAESGNWDVLRDAIAEALASTVDPASFRDAIASVALLATATDRLDSLLGTLQSVQLPSRAYRLKKLRREQSLRINDLKLRVRRRWLRVRNYLLRKAGNVVRRLHRFRAKSHRVTYYPAFENVSDLSNHYYRACWYLPFVENFCEEVLFYQSCGTTLESHPAFMAASPSSTEHIQFRRGRWRNALKLLRSDLVVLWKKDTGSKTLTFLARFCGIKIINVATDDLGSKEFGAYCSLIWNYLMTERDRDVVVAANKQRFEEIAKRVQSEGFERSCVFGTGPSLAEAETLDLGHSLNIVCNSLVQNEGLLDALAPRFICAGDVVSHLGVSAYAQRFRDDLIRALEQRDMTFVTTASFGMLFLFHYPALEGKVVLLPQTCSGPNFDLLANFGSPRLDSTMNIHMLPLAATFTKTILMLGCDGKAASDENEDFWPHAKTAQYHDLVDSGHQCHPTFDVHRQLSTYDRYLSSVELTVSEGERDHGIRYLTLAPSNVPALRTREITAEDYVAMSIRRGANCGEL